MNANIATILWDRATTDPERRAIVQTVECVSYGRLCSQAAGISRVLASETEIDDRVAILLERGAGAAAAFFGVVGAGGIAVNINETLRPRQIEHILDHAGARILLTSSVLISRLPRPLRTRARVLDVAGMAGDPGAAYDPRPRLGSDVAQILYTSGSTGLPKGVAITHDNLRAGMLAVISYLALTANDRIASLLPFSFDYGFNQLLCAVGTGATLIVERSHLAPQIAKTLRAEAVTVLPAVPPLWAQLLQVPAFTDAPIASLRVLTNTGGHLPIAAVRALRRAHPSAELVLMYGLTEAFRSTYLPSRYVDQRPDSIGMAIPGAEILVIRDDGTPCEPNEVGELVHRGPTVTAGYWNDAEATRCVFRPNLLHPSGAPAAERVVYSGDLVRRDAEGFLYYMGRRDRMIKTLGYRVSPDEIVDALHASGEIAEAVVTTEPDQLLGDRVVAHVVLQVDGSVADLTAFCRAELPRYLQPARFEVHEQLPRTASGKYDPRSLDLARDPA